MSSAREEIVITVERREEAGKSAAAKLRREKKVPAVDAPLITLLPPYQITKATPTPARLSITGEVNAL